MSMTHPGLPLAWALILCLFMCVLSLWALLKPLPSATPKKPAKGFSLSPLPPRLLLAARIIFVLLFLLVIAAGLYGTQIPERNIATVLTWNIWWAGLVLVIFFLGSAWCGVCPWDTLATWLVPKNSRLNLTVPAGLRTVWPALLMFIGLTWLELGVGITTNPYATAVLALLMLLLATVSLAVFEKKAFCRYFCPVGRTVGFYAQLAPVALRPLSTDVCASCQTLACYHGNASVEPCPTQLVMGRLSQNTYCTSCGNCTQSCPHDNIVWRLRAPGVDSAQHARPHWDEAWFMLVLMALTAFHGVSMLPFWETGSLTLAQWIGDSGQHLWTFSISLCLALLLLTLPYGLATGWLKRTTRTAYAFKRVFTHLAFVTIPLAFAYHIAHNLNHLMRESVGLGHLLSNPLGLDTLPLSMLEKHQRHMHMLLPETVLYSIQIFFLMFGFILAVVVLRHRGGQLLPQATRTDAWRLYPMLGFAIGMTGVHLWLLSQPMIMRM